MTSNVMYLPKLRVRRYWRIQFWHLRFRIQRTLALEHSSFTRISLFAFVVSNCFFIPSQLMSDSAQTRPQHSRPYQLTLRPWPSGEVRSQVRSSRRAMVTVRGRGLPRLAAPLGAERWARSAASCWAAPVAAAWPASAIAACSGTAESNSGMGSFQRCLCKCRGPFRPSLACSVLVDQPHRHCVPCC